MPVAAMLTAVLFWSGLLVAQKFLGGVLGVAEIALCRFALAAAILWAIVLATRQPVRIRTRAEARPLLMGILEPGATGLLVIWGLQYTSVITAAVLWSIMPLVMPVLGRIVLKEPLRLIVAVSAVIAVTGSAVLVTGQESSGQGSLLGDILVFLGVSCACTNQLIARTVARTGGRPLVTTSYQVTASATLALVVLAFSGGFQVDFASLDATAIGSMLFLGVGGGIGTFLLYNFALRYMPVGRVSLFPPLVGPVGTVMAALLLGEHVSVTDGMAIAVILFAAMLPTLVAKTEYGRKTIA